MGWVCGNAQTIEGFGNLKCVTDTGLFKALQKAGAELLTSVEGDEYIKCANVKFEKKLTKFVQGLRELGFDAEVPKATFYLWLKHPAKYASAKEFCDELLVKSGIVAVPGTAFGKCGEGYIRMSIVADEAALDEVIARMKEDGHRFEE
jgi:LL-diaminopimelate aminotransferase